MLPYIHWQFIELGPVTLQVWGLLVALGIVVAAIIGKGEAKRRGLDTTLFIDLTSWILVPAFIVARLFHIAFYDLAPYLETPSRIFAIWEGGMSMFGGFVGAAIGAWLFSKRHDIKMMDYIQALVYGLPLGAGIGRIGCALIHDHPGMYSGGLLSVQYPGGARLDHGLLLSVVGFLMFLFFVGLRKYWEKKCRPNYAAWYLVLYGTARFGLDFYRAWDLELSDARYLNLTPAQYGSVLLIALGLYLFRSSECQHIEDKEMDSTENVEVEDDDVQENDAEVAENEERSEDTSSEE